MTQVVFLSRKLYAGSMEEGADLMQHITMMTSLFEQLRELDTASNGHDDREKPRGPKCHKCKNFGHVVGNCPQKRW